jgi:MFS family permease
MSKLAVACMQIGYLVLKFAVTPLMGRAVDRWGARVVMVAVGPIYTVFFFMYVLATPEHRWPVFLGWALAGIADCAYGLAYFSALYGALPQDRTRSGYLAVMNLLTLGAYATGAALAGLLIQPLANVHIELPGLTLGPVAGWSWSYPGTTIGQFQALYVVATLLMFAGTFAAILYPRRDTRRQPRPEADEVLLGH